MKKKKRKLIFIIVFILFIVGITISTIYFLNENAKKIIALEEQYQEKQRKAAMDKIYNDCLNEPYKDSSIDTIFADLTAQLNEKNISIYFEDLKNNYTLTFSENRSQYGASIIKLFMASYLIDNVRWGNIDLEQTLTYTANYRAYAGELLKTHTINEEISLSTLLSYSISISDNGAYLMLIDYITRNTLEQYAKNTLNINLNIDGTTPYANLTVTDTNTLLKHIFEIIQVDDEYSTLLVNAMNNTYYNGLNFDNITFLHKYGYYSSYYNDIGIYNSNNNPYLISIFTLYGNTDESHLTKTSEISKQIYNIYITNLEAKNNYCQTLAYT